MKRAIALFTSEADRYTLVILNHQLTSQAAMTENPNQFWQDIGGTHDANYEIWYHFCEQVGWRINKSWVEYDNLAFHLDAPQGHLPFLVVGGFGVVVCLQSLLSRLEN